MDIAREYREHKGHVFHYDPYCRLCRAEKKKKEEAEALERERELHDRIADTLERSKRNVNGKST